MAAWKEPSGVSLAGAGTPGCDVAAQKGELATQRLKRASRAAPPGPCLRAGVRAVQSGGRARLGSEAFGASGFFFEHQRSAHSWSEPVNQGTSRNGALVTKAPGERVLRGATPIGPQIMPIARNS